MNYKMMGRFLSQTLFVETLFMIPALLISIFCGEIAAWQAFLLAMAIMLAVTGILHLICKSAPNALNAKDGLVCGYQNNSYKSADNQAPVIKEVNKNYCKNSHIFKGIAKLIV